MPDTHQVLNQPPPLVNYNLYTSDVVLSQGISRGGAKWHHDALTRFGAKVGSARFMELGRLANRHPPKLHTHDRFGHRIDEVEFHPAWHEVIAAGVEAGVHSLPWRQDAPDGSHVARVAAHYLLTQIEAGVGCPLTMTFAAVPALRKQPEISAIWEPRLTSQTYDAR
ncbi:MAG: DNA alkylation response protein, partial [Nannocystaceae bacterium]